jgi:hypothetical protein
MTQFRLPPATGHSTSFLSATSTLIPKHATKWPPPGTAMSTEPQTFKAFHERSTDSSLICSPEEQFFTASQN